MKKYKLVQIEGRELIGVWCDRCGEEIPLPNSQTEFRQFTLEFSHGKFTGPSQGRVEGWRVEDLCDRCLGILKDTLTAEGFTVTEIDEEI